MCGFAPLDSNRGICSPGWDEMPPRQARGIPEFERASLADVLRRLDEGGPDAQWLAVGAPPVACLVVTRGSPAWARFPAPEESEANRVALWQARAGYIRGG